MSYMRSVAYRAFRYRRGKLKSFNPRVIYCHKSVTSFGILTESKTLRSDDDKIPLSFHVRDDLRSMRKRRQTHESPSGRFQGEHHRATPCLSHRYLSELLIEFATADCGDQVSITDGNLSGDDTAIAVCLSLRL